MSSQRSGPRSRSRIGPSPPPSNPVRLEDVSDRIQFFRAEGRLKQVDHLIQNAYEELKSSGSRSTRAESSQPRPGGQTRERRRRESARQAETESQAEERQRAEEAHRRKAARQAATAQQQYYDKNRTQGYVMGGVAIAVIAIGFAISQDQPSVQRATPPLVSSQTTTPPPTAASPARSPCLYDPSCSSTTTPPPTATLGDFRVAANWALIRSRTTREQVIAILGQPTSRELSNRNFVYEGDVPGSGFVRGSLFFDGTGRLLTRDPPVF